MDRYNTLMIDGIDTIVYSSVCARCRRFTGMKTGDRVCEAFPGGIPDEIWIGKNPHTAPYPGDGGKMFSPRPGVLPTPGDHSRFHGTLTVTRGEDDTRAPDEVQKGERIYVTPKHPAPPGAKLYRGDRGGVFYFGSRGGKGEGMLDPKRPGKGPAGAPSSRGRPTRPPVPGGPRGRDPDRPETRSGVDRFIRRPERQGVESEFRSIDELRTVLASTKYALISAGRNPKREPDEPEETFQKRHEQLRADLAAAGYTYTQVLGSYGDFEDSFLVMAHDADLAPMLELGAKYNQDSIIWADHGTNYMVYTTDSQDDDGNAIAAGSYLKGEGYEEIDLDAGDYFTEVHLSEAGKNARFSLNFDWDTLHQPEDLKGR